MITGGSKYKAQFELILFENGISLQRASFVPSSQIHSSPETDTQREREKEGEGEGERAREREKSLIPDGESLRDRTWDRVLKGISI